MSASIEISWLGHATVLVEDRARILTDPVLTATLLHLHRRAGPLPPDLSSHVDAVAVSHLHHDHLHLPSLRLLDPGTPVLLPRGGGSLLRGTRLEAVEVTAGDVVDVGDVTIEAVPAVHADTRLPWSRIRGAPLGYVLRGRGTTYFAGDTSLFPGIGDLVRSPDVALLPVGGWGPSLRGHHMDPEDAAHALGLLDPGVTVPVHYGTFWPRGIPWVRTHLFHEPGRTFEAHVRRLAPSAEVRVIDPGTSTTVELPTPARPGR